MSSSQVLFVIVGRNEPLFEAEIDTSHSSSTAGGANQQQSSKNELAKRQNYFVLHSSLDMVEKHAWTTNNMYLRVIDNVNKQQISTFLTAANVKFMLLHERKGEEVIKNFFNEVYGYYVKVREIDVKLSHIIYIYAPFTNPHCLLLLVFLLPVVNESILQI